MHHREHEATAYHEAGHAVVALALGQPVHRVSMVPTHDHLGRCELRKGVPRPSQDWLECQILITLGGLAAEAKHSGVYAWELATRDRQYVRQLAAERAGPRRAERLEQRLLAKVEHLLGRAGYWRAVELIAAELLRRGVISGRAARHLFDQSCATDPT
jgi:hypothetical protein